MMKTGYFTPKYLKSAYQLFEFCADHDIKIEIMSDYLEVSKLSLQPTEFFFLKYEKAAQLLIEYWIFANDIRFQEMHEDLSI